MIRVIVESPYAGDNATLQDNIIYARKCIKDCLYRGEAPFASHLLYTQDGILDDKNKKERNLGIQAGFVWRELADKTVVYTDRGTTPGMMKGIEDSINKNIPIEYRTLKDKNNEM